MSCFPGGRCQLCRPLLRMGETWCLLIFSEASGTRSFPPIDRGFDFFSTSRVRPPWLSQIRQTRVRIDTAVIPPRINNAFRGSFLPYGKGKTVRLSSCHSSLPATFALPFPPPTDDDDDGGHVCFPLARACRKRNISRSV